MLIPLTRQKFEQLIPLTATAVQYKYHWGKFPDFLKRLLISVVGGAAALLMEVWWGRDFGAPILIFGICVGLYWLWGPVLWATLRNAETRKYAYSGFWQGRVLDVYITEELVGKEETVNKRGELVIIENRERRLNLEVGDETGFMSELQVPLKRSHQVIAPGQIAQMLVMSYQPDLSNIVKTSDIYIPSHNLWVSDYPYLQRDSFVEVSRQLRARNTQTKSPNNSPRRSARRRAAMDAEP